MEVKDLYCLTLVLSVFFFHQGDGTTFTFSNKCGETVWPAILSNAGSSQLLPTGFELPTASSRSLQAPAGWSGRFWARTRCSAAGAGSAWACATGDCGSGQVDCHGAGATPPVTLAEFTLASGAGQRADFYDVSLVDGYNLPVLVEATRRGCAAAGCAVDLGGQRCPAELRRAGGGACRSACDAFRKPEYCCSGAYASPAACRPTAYSKAFKEACPNAYSYAFDDPTSTFTCAGGGDYTITFCPESVPSLKSSGNSSSFAPASSSSSSSSSTPTPTPTPASISTLTPAPATTSTSTAAPTTISTSTPASISTSTSSSTSTPTSTTSSSPARPAGDVMLVGDTWLASMATGEAIPTRNRAPLVLCSSIAAMTAYVILLSPL